MVGYAKNAPKDEEWLREKIAEKRWSTIREFSAFTCEIEWKDVVNKRNRKECYEYADQILALIEEGGWVSPAYLKDALSRELMAGYRLGKNKPKEVNDDNRW